MAVAIAFARLPEAQADRRRRRSLNEGSFAHAAIRYHFKRARWRRLPRQQIQDWIIAAVQNIARLCGATGAGVAANNRKSPAKARPRPRARHFFARTADNGAIIVRFPRYSDFPDQFRAA